MREKLSHRERVLLALDHRETDRAPFAMVCSGINSPARENLEQYLKEKRDISLAEWLERLLDIETVMPPLKGKTPEPGWDIWGVHRAPVSHGGGGYYDEIDFFPLADFESPGDLRRHNWPSPDIFDYSALPGIVAKTRRTGNRCLMAANGNIFESSWYMRGFERVLMDFVLNPDFAHALLDKVCEFYIEYFTRILSAVPGEIDLVFTADDIAGQNGLLISPETWETFIKPRHMRLNQRIHSLGAKVIYHSDGAVMDAVPGLIDMGIDILQALQFDAAGMDPLRLKRDFGDKLCFEGGVSVQKTLPFGTPEEVRAEVSMLVSTLGKNGGYILGPSHAIQAGTPPENIAAFFDAAARE
jgi:uroporphyrinogen decarboxylase